MITEHAVEQGTPAWKELRAGKYTGSNAHKLLRFGMIDYSLTNVGTFGGNFWTQRGHILEEQAIRLYERITKAEVRRVGFVTNSLYPTCGYSPDGLTDDKVIEVKCFDTPKHLMIMKATKPSEVLAYVPFPVLAQIHYGMFLCDRPMADLLLLNPNFAKKKLPDGSGNPEYDPKKAFKIITIRSESAIRANLRRILKAKEQSNALHPQAA